MAVLKLHTNQEALTTEDKKLLANFINANMGKFMHYHKENHGSEAQLSRLMAFVENHATPFDDSMTDIDL
jgi:hypothetical protein